MLQKEMHALDFKWTITNEIEIYCECIGKRK